MVESIDKINNYFRNKKVLILGYGKEGQASYKYIREHLPFLNLGIADANEVNIANHSYLKDDGFLRLHFGSYYLDAIKDYDIILKSPGISLKDVDTRKIREKLTSQTDLFLKFASKNIVGVTGTKGKSTTSSLIKHILSISNPNVNLIGNIGIPPFEVVDSINDETIIVFELSSHQLEYISCSPKISVLLNIYEEHLDHYNSFLDYQEAKLNICSFQEKDDYFIYNIDNPIISRFVENDTLPHNKVPISFDSTKSGSKGIFVQGDYINYMDNQQVCKIYDINSKRELLGNHNLYNIMTAIGACKALGVENDIIIKGISTFKGLPHRMEFVGKYDDIYFYNDSIATIPEAAIFAIESIGNVDTLIAGGFDRGINYEDFGIYLANSNIRNIIFLPSTSKVIWEVMKKNSKETGNNLKVYFVQDLSEAVKLAKEKTAKDKTCLFSPAAASYGYFKNFEHRGDMFKKLVEVH